MRISFHGAAREVTGSCHLVETDRGRILLDCGLFQGGKERHARNRESFGFEPTAIDCVVLSHAHIDHSGRLPVLAQRGFRGPIYATEPTGRLLEIMLADSGKIQEEDARHKRRRLERRGKDASWVAPLYTREQGLKACERVEPLAFDRWRDLGKLGRLRFHRAGHILGAAIVELELYDGDRKRRLVFSGDLGVHGARLLGPPASVEAPEILIMESTYGDRERDEGEDRTERLFEIVDEAQRRGGKVVIPSFAVGRTQEVLARLNDLVEGGRLSLPVFVDSPMAVEATGVFASFPDAWSKAARELLGAGDRPLEFPGLRLVTEVAESKRINDSPMPAVVISASGMCTAGRVKHHLRHNISDGRAAILFVGYQARGTLGDVILRGIDPVRIFGDWHRVRARIERIEGFSAHADRSELLRWFASLGRVPDRTFIVHGEEEAAAALSSELRSRHDAETIVPERHDVFEL